MLTAIKEMLMEEKRLENGYKAIVENSDRVVRDMFLDDIETVVDGAENDPEIKALIETIPEYDEEDDILETEIEAMTESLIETII